MLTRKRLPSLALATEDGQRIWTALSTYLMSLEGKDSLTIGQAQIYVDQGLQFPATQVPSTDPNNLDDYEESSPQPSLTFATPGDLAVTYTTRSLEETKIGRLIAVHFTIVTASFTHSTAAGALQITGLTTNSKALTGAFFTGGLFFSNLTLPAGFTQVTPYVDQSAKIIKFARSKTTAAAVATDVITTDTTSGTNLTLSGFVIYPA